MKKSSKILGSVALSAALVMGTAIPAFAYDPINAEDATTELNNRTEDLTSIPSDRDKINGASTTVNVSTYTSQISATLPLNLTVALDKTGGNGVTPTAAYKIVNTCQENLKVSDVAWKITDAQRDEWGFPTTAWTDASTAADFAAPDAAVATVGLMQLNLAPVGKESVSTTAMTAKSATEGAKGHRQVANWSIDKSGTENGKDTLTIPLQVYGSVLNVADDTPLTNVCSITYTIERNVTAPVTPGSGA